MSEASPRIEFLPGGGAISTIYTFVSPGFQLAANSVYVQKSTFDSLPQNIAKGKLYTFKTQQERLQYLIGQLGTATRFS